MKQALTNMLEMQDRMNKKVHPQWVEQQFAWPRAIWIECAELMDHQGYKWWKKQQPEIEQVQLEVIDIWHFGMSALFDGRSIDEIATAIDSDLKNYSVKTLSVLDATEAVAEFSLRTKGFDVCAFWDLLHASGLNFDSLYKQYVGKNVLNFFRQDHGYKDGTYHKTWSGKEDNEHLIEVLQLLDASAEDFSDAVYKALGQRYPA